MKTTVLIAAALLCFEARAVRTQSVTRTIARTTVTRPSAPWLPAGLAGGICNFAVRIRNLSKITQTAKITFHDAGLGWGMLVLNPSGMSGFPSPPPAGSGGWFTTSRNSSDPIVKTVGINPLSEEEARLMAACQSKKAAASTCELNPSSITAAASELMGDPWVGGASSPNCAVSNVVCGADLSLTTNITVEIQEERGAVLGVVFAECVVHNSTDGITKQSVFYPMNGGRAF